MHPQGHALTRAGQALDDLRGGSDATAEETEMIKTGKWTWIGGAMGVLLGLSGCAVELENLKPAQELAQAAAPPGSIDLGWRVYQDKCARCHGPAALGTRQGPDLLPRVREMGMRRFVGSVLYRYEGLLTAAPAGSDPAAREALIDQVMRREQGLITMPAWQDQPRVNAHILDLYAYLSARAQGTQGPNRPAP